MTAPGRYAASDGSFAKSAGSAAARGGGLIAIALVIGFVLLRWGFDGGDADAGAPIGDNDASSSQDDADNSDDTVDDNADNDADNQDDSEGDPDTTTTEGGGEDDPDTTTTQAAAVLDPPSSITVAVLNGTGESGLAGNRGETLGALGYVWKPGNASGVPVAESKVYFVTGFGDEAGEVAAALSGPATVLELAPDDPTTLATDAYAEDVADADIIVVLGADNALS